MSTSMTLTLGDRGRLVLPKQIRDEQGLSVGDRLVVTSDAQGIVLMTLTQLKAKVQADFKQYPGSLADELIAERRQAAQRELEP